MYRSRWKNVAIAQGAHISDKFDLCVTRRERMRQSLGGKEMPACAASSKEDRSVAHLN
jgi:hypothetical protein